MIGALPRRSPPLAGVPPVFTGHTTVKCQRHRLLSCRLYHPGPPRLPECCQCSPETPPSNASTIAFCHVGCTTQARRLRLSVRLRRQGCRRTAGACPSKSLRAPPLEHHCSQIPRQSQPRSATRGGPRNMRLVEASSYLVGPRCEQCRMAGACVGRVL